MNPRDILALAGACLLAVGGFLSQQPANSTPWWIGQVFIIIGPILMAVRAVTSTNQANKTIAKAVEESSKPTIAIVGEGGTSTGVYSIPKTVAINQAKKSTNNPTL